MTAWCIYGAKIVLIFDSQRAELSFNLIVKFSENGYYSYTNRYLQ